MTYIYETYIYPFMQVQVEFCCSKQRPLGLETTKTYRRDRSDIPVAIDNELLMTGPLVINAQRALNETADQRRLLRYIGFCML